VRDGSPTRDGRGTPASIVVARETVRTQSDSRVPVFADQACYPPGFAAMQQVGVADGQHADTLLVNNAAVEKPTANSVKIAVISALSNLAIQYNLSGIALALAYMDNGTDHPAYPRSTSQTSLLGSLVFAGAIVGQLTMGLLGDVIGRRHAMLLTNSCTVLGSLGTAVFTWGSPDTIYAVMGLCRFILGVGVGGKYPLAATMSSEATGRNDKRSPIEVAKGFFWQTPGAILPYVVGLLLLSLFGRDNHGADHMSATSVQFRLVLGLGALPIFVSTILTYTARDSDSYNASRTAARSPWKVVRAHPELLGRLVGCGLSWGLYDFIYYGTSFNQVDITQSVFGKNESLFDSCWQNAVLTAMGLPGVILAILALYRFSSRALQLWGFALILAVSLALAAAHAYAPHSTSANFALFCLLIFALNFGPNVSTYTLPTEIFPTAVRSTCFGLCAAMGKAGALIGTASFGAINEAIGLSGIYLICAALSALGCVVTFFFVPREQEPVTHYAR